MQNGGVHRWKHADMNSEAKSQADKCKSSCSPHSIHIKLIRRGQYEAANIFRVQALWWPLLLQDGQGELRVVPCLNDTDEAVAVLESLVLENTKQWRPKPRR